MNFTIEASVMLLWMKGNLYFFIILKHQPIKLSISNILNI